MKILTNRQKQILSFIRVYTAKTGQAPLVREIGKEFCIRSSNGIASHLKSIEAKGKQCQCITIQVDF
ncbi:MAG: hypothetical protein K0U86_09995 [Planctomycetes bacterium]|nr:hypothetical protein [Planctomycetota bacterium]MCH9725222.1 hypothetical protein [Planctomycetota bacterium]MCH9779006.1 hypothetical protein [Planctomycetota bacterium]MCH9791353.1 hypothetical protein [Planctomycetota bacterium]